MSDEASPQITPGEDAIEPTASTHAAEETPAAAAADAPSEDAVYDQAFANLMGPDAPESTESGQPPANGGQEGQEQQQADPEAPDLSDDHQQLLSRQHVTPEMFAKWTPEQQTEFLENAAKRERDQTTSYKQLKEKLAKLGGDDDDDAEAGEGEQERETPAGELGELGDQVQHVVDELVDVYGEEMKPLGDVLNRVAGVADQLQTRVDRAETSGRVKDQLIVEMTIDTGMRDLQGDFPSLDKTEARERVVKRFESDWRGPNSRHRTGNGPLLNRLRSALRDAASAEFSNTTESAAQVALANKNKERLRTQPTAGSSRGRKPQLTEDDVYDQAFDEHLAPDLKT